MMVEPKSCRALIMLSLREALSLNSRLRTRLGWWERPITKMPAMVKTMMMARPIHHLARMQKMARPIMMTVTYGRSAKICQKLSRTFCSLLEAPSVSRRGTEFGFVCRVCFCEVCSCLSWYCLRDILAMINSSFRIHKPSTSWLAKALFSDGLTKIIS